MVLLVEDGVRPECLRDVLVEVRGEGQVGVKVEDEAPLRPAGPSVSHVQEYHVIIPDHKFVLLTAGLLAPQGDNLKRGT